VLDRFLERMLPGSVTTKSANSWLKRPPKEFLERTLKA